MTHVLRGFFIFRPALHRFVAGYGYFSISNVKDLDLVQNAVTRLFSIASPAYPDDAVMLILNYGVKQLGPSH